MNRYLFLTRSHTYSVAFVLPLLLLYEAGAAQLARVEESSLRNGADVLLRTLLSIGGLQSTLTFTFAILAVAAAVVLLERRRNPLPLRFTPFLGMIAESITYALLLGVVVGSATRLLLDGLAVPLASGAFENLSFTQGVVLSLGAGVYEELVFRVLLVGGIFAVFRGGGLPPTQAGLFAVVLAALLFSAFHYVGPYGDPWALPSFLFRFLAGLAFSVLFLLRGFGITAWTHALYDLFLLVALAL